MIRVIDNFLREDEAIGMPHFFSNEFPWHLGTPVYGKKLGNNEKYNFHFGHLLYDKLTFQSDYFRLVLPILQILNPSALLKVKANLTTCGECIVEHGMHTDNSFKDAFTAIYYVNSNNGYTIFENGEKVDSVKNRLVYFPSHFHHSGTNCTDEKHRVVININYFKDSSQN